MKNTDNDEFENFILDDILAEKPKKKKTNENF
jgi:hypothetical protein